MKSNFLYPIILFAGLMIASFTSYVIYGQSPQKELTTKQIVKYTCSMHPEIIKDKPGNCPICGMLLIVKKSDVKKIQPQTASIPGNLYAIFKNSCMDCHGTTGNSFETSMLDFSKWDQYKPDKKAKKAAAICRRITKNSMPPKSYLKANPKAILTAAQKDSICKWSATFAIKK